MEKYKRNPRLERIDHPTLLHKEIPVLSDPCRLVLTTKVVALDAGRDAIEVAKFRALFARLKDWCDDDPASLTNGAQDDPGLRTLCSDVYARAQWLRQADRAQRRLFTAPVDENFVAAWRDYEQRYESRLFDIESWDARERPVIIPSTFLQKDSDLEWEAANASGHDEALGLVVIELGAMLGAQAANEQVAAGVPPGRDVKTVEDGLRAWRRLEEECGLNAAAVFRRRALVPFVNIPTKLSNRVGSSEKISLPQALQQAHDAFVWGAPYAALALMRSVAEAVLRDHYKVFGANLERRIASASSKIGSQVAGELEDLRLLANAVVHTDARDKKLKAMSEKQLEQRIASFLRVLRDLIEQST